MPGLTTSWNIPQEEGPFQDPSNRIEILKHFKTSTCAIRGETECGSYAHRNLSLISETIATLPGPIRGSLGREQGESTWDPLNASDLAPNSANGLFPSLIAWAESQPAGNVATVSVGGSNPLAPTDQGHHDCRLEIHNLIA